MYEPFLGSGTTLVAAAMTRRWCIGLELSPVYVDVGVRRWAEFTGETPILEETGEPWDVVVAARAAARSEA